MFLSRPEPDASQPLAVSLRQELEASPGYFTFDRVVGKVRSDPALARAVFLSEGRRSPSRSCSAIKSCTSCAAPRS
jgi:hypothetical protein